MCNHKENTTPGIGNFIKTLISRKKPATMEQMLVQQSGLLDPFTAEKLSDLGQVTALLWALLFLSVKQSDLKGPSYSDRR